MKLVITDIENPSFAIKGEYKLIKPDKQIKNCIGCFGCWIKTPGKCVIKDGYELMGSNVGKCREIILISRCTYGSVSPFVKAVQDRCLSFVLGDFADRRGEMHHKLRYDNDVTFSAHIYGDDITEDEKETIKGIIDGNADNYNGDVKGVYFYTSEKDLEGIEI